MNGYVVSKKNIKTNQQTKSTYRAREKNSTEIIIKVFFDEKRIIITSGSTGPFVSLGFVLCCRAHKQTHTHTRSLVHPTYLHLFVALAHTQPNPVRANYCAFVVRRNINISPLRNTRFQFTQRSERIKLAFARSLFFSPNQHTNTYNPNKYWLDSIQPMPFIAQQQRAQKNRPFKYEF